MGKNGQWISPDDRREDRALRESLKTNTDNVIPERMSQPTSISMEMNTTPNRPLMDLPKHPPRVHNKEDQGKNPKSKGDIPIYECAIHLSS
jgi:hypothetical protein